MGHRLVHGAAFHCPLAGGPPIACCLRMRPRAREVACEQLWPRLRDSRKVGDQRLRDPRMIALPSGAKKRVIGGVSNEGVLEAVNWRRDALPEDQARLQHQVELGPYGILWRLCNGHEQIMGE